jgi:hypothetical protein
VTGGKACGSCDAQNAVSAEFCWRCYARFGAAAAAVPAAVGAPAALGASAAPAAAPMPTAAAPWQTGGRYGEQTSLPEPIPESRWPVRQAVNVLLLVAVALGGFLAWRMVTGDPFPDTIRGVGRVDAQAAKVFEDAVSETGKELGVKMHGAVYGNEVDMAFMAVLSERTGSVDHLGGAFQQGLPIAGSPFTEGGSSTFEHDGASFECLAVQAEATGTICYWTDAKTVGLVFAMEVGVEAGFELAADVRSAVI